MQTNSSVIFIKQNYNHFNNLQNFNAALEHPKLIKITWICKEIQIRYDIFSRGIPH